MTPDQQEPQKEYIITEDELNWIHNHDAYYKIKSRPYDPAAGRKAERERVLDKINVILDAFKDPSGDCPMLNHINFEGTCVEYLKNKIAELRQQESTGKVQPGDPP